MKFFYIGVQFPNFRYVYTKFLDIENPLNSCPYVCGEVH